MIKAIIIDDEKKSREALFHLLQRYCPNVSVLDEADGCVKGIKVIKKHKPDVVFLDIQMPDGSGFKLLEEVGEINFEIVFTTAFDQYAIKAIKYSALDYLLKPIIPDDLKSAVKKLEKNADTSHTKTNVNILLENNKSKNNDLKKIVLSTIEGLYVVEVKNIIRCESDGCYTRFILLEGKTIMVSKTLKDIEELLEEFNFIRPHKSHLINLTHVKTVNKIDGGTIVMSDASHVPVSRRRRELVVDFIHHL